MQVFVSLRPSISFDVRLNLRFGVEASVISPDGDKESLSRNQLLQYTLPYPGGEDGAIARHETRQPPRHRETP